MAESVENSVIDDLTALVRAQRWDEVQSFFEQELSRAERDQPKARLRYAIALIRLGRINSGVGMLTPAMIIGPEAVQLVRQHVMTWLGAEKRWAAGVTVLDCLIAANPDLFEERAMRATYLAKQGHYQPAIDELAALIDSDRDDVQSHISYLLYLLQDGQVEVAADHAARVGTIASESDRLAGLALLALIRARRTDDMLSMAREIDRAGVHGPEGAGLVVRALMEAKQVDEAIDKGEQYVRDGLDGTKLRHFLGQSYMKTRRDDRFDRAIEHLSKVAVDNRPDPNALALLGEAYLRVNRLSEAIKPLEQAVKANPRVPHIRSLYAKALKQNGQVAEAAREFRRLLAAQPSSHRWHRYAAGSLAQAGHTAEAANLFDEFVQTRRAALSDDFEQGLQALWDKVDEVRIPKARLDWAWSLRSGPPVDRAEWERRAKWGHLADHYILDWLECRDDRIHEAMGRLADLSDAERALGSIDRSRGMVLASAHVGPMYAGPLALELLGVQSQWLASTPSVARTAYARNLISTSDKTGADVGKEVIWSVRQGNAVVIAIDGAINLAAPRVAFAGQEITYSSFASRVAHRLQVPSLFVAPKWVDGRIGFVLDIMPEALPDESADDHAERWQAAYLESLKRYLSGAPENLRLSGGIWRYLGPGSATNE